MNLKRFTLKVFAMLVGNGSATSAKNDAVVAHQCAVAAGVSTCMLKGSVMSVIRTDNDGLALSVALAKF